LGNVPEVSVILLDQKIPSVRLFSFLQAMLQAPHPTQL
jgi:hypothetical protein